MAYAEDVRVVGTLGALNNAVQVNYPTMATVTFQLVGTSSQTVTFEANNDEGSSPSWVAIPAANIATDVVATTATAAGIYRIDASGFRTVRARCSTYSSGSFTVTCNASAAPTTAGGNAQSVTGDVGGYTSMVTVTLTRGANTTAYTAQDEVATGSTSPATFAVSRLSGGTGLITGAKLVYAANPATTPAFRVLIFSATVTAAGDNGALALSTADGSKLIGVIDLTTTQAGGSTTSSPLYCSGAPNHNIPFTTDNVYVLLMTTNGFTPIANSETIVLTLDLERN